jgi:hypothetical protein
MTVGVGALATKKKLKCQQCDEYNQVGNAKPYAGPENKKYLAQYQREQVAKLRASAPASAAPLVQPPSTLPSIVDKLKGLASLHDAGALSDEEFEAAKAKILEGS